MAEMVVAGALAQCTMGNAPAPLKVSSNQKVMGGGRPMATIQDMAGITNVGPFGMCMSLANPQVAAATSAAMGVLTPQPCMPVPAGTWIPTKPMILVSGKPCLTKDCQLMCSYAGSISINVPGQFKVVAK